MKNNTIQDSKIFLKVKPSNGLGPWDYNPPALGRVLTRIFLSSRKFNNNFVLVKFGIYY